MNDLYNTQTNTEQNTPQKKPKSGWTQSIASGVIGSLLTCGVFLVAGDQIFSTETVQTETADLQTTEPVKTEQSTNVVNTSATNTSVSLADMVETASTAIVGVVNYQQSSMNPYSQTTEEVESGTGSGVMYKTDGDNAYIVTNNHVIEGATKVEVSLYNGEKTTAEVVGADALTDLAVLKIDSSLAPDTIKFGDSDTIRAGEEVIAIGNPLGLDFSRTVTQGIVSAAERSIEVETSSGVWELDVIQTDAAINPGNSGGALINTNGEVIGINSLKISSDGVEGLGFAIPSNDVIPIVEEIIKSGKITRPYLGVGLADLSEIPQNYMQNSNMNKQAGVMVTNVEANSAAADGGFQQQDIITSINGTAITSAAELRKFLYTEVKVGDQVKFEVIRGNETITLNVTLGES
jgi:serine protease Do